MAEGLLRNPFVVQCKECRRVLTDSFTLQNMRHGHLVHTHSTATPQDSERPGTDIFTHSVLRDVSCECTAPVGVYIVSASAEWNGCAGMFAFEKDRVRSYVLGTDTGDARSLHEMYDDLERLKVVVAKIYKKVYQ